VRIRWNGKRWLIMPDDISEDEETILRQADFTPEYYDNWTEGDIYTYDKTLAVGWLMETLGRYGKSLEVING
jgi:hypothetical protein